MKTHHDHSKPYNGKHFSGASLQVQSNIIMAGSMEVHRKTWCWRRSSTSGSMGNRNRETLGMAWVFETSQPSDTLPLMSSHLCQQSHTSLKPLPGDQAFKSIILWRSLLFRLSQPPKDFLFTLCFQSADAMWSAISSLPSQLYPTLQQWAQINPLGHFVSCTGITVTRKIMNTASHLVLRTAAFSVPVCLC